MNNLPNEILENIFMFCNIKSIINLSNTCLLFRKIVTNSNFKITINTFYELTLYIKNCKKNKIYSNNLIIKSKNLWIPKLANCYDVKVHHYYLNIKLTNYQQLILLKHIHKMPGNIKKVYYKKLENLIKNNDYEYFNYDLVSKALLNIEFEDLFS